jgi:hypothetical protein
MNQLGELLILGFLIAVPIVGWITVGAYLMYSAITGRGLEKPERGARLVVRLWYALRGFFGLVFLVTGVLMIAMVLCSW